MKNPFENSGQKPKNNSFLLGIDAWIDSTVFRFLHGFAEWWESVTIFFRRFRVTGFKKFMVEILDEGFTIGVIGLFLLAFLAVPAFKETKKDWRNLDNYSVEFQDRYGRVIGRRGIRQHTIDNVDKLPDYFIKAVLSTEDRRFFEHYGVDFFGLFRALVTNLRADGVVQGGSTLTQQLAKNLFLSNERTLSRKVKEVFLAFWLEANLSKKEILTYYLNRTYMGGGNFGVAAAAQYYFDKSINDVSLSEAAMLAGLYQAPSKYAPTNNLPAARARANEVLTNMVQAGFMTEGQVVGARRDPAVAVEREDIEGPNYFVDWAYDELKNITNKFPNRIFTAKTTVDLDLQKLAADTLSAMLRQYGKQYGVSQGAMVVIDHTGAVRAIVGGKDYGESQFNRATQSLRQPGSSFKPFVYASSFDHFGYNANTSVIDGPVTYKNWSPRNYERRYRGRTNMTTALLKSLNTIPVKLYLGRDGLKELGRDKLKETLLALGIDTEMNYSPAMVLGANGVTVMEMAAGYGAFIQDGMKVDRHGITLLRDDEGEVVWDYNKNKPEAVRALKESTVKSINRILVQNPIRGTARRAKLNGIPSAGKTGTTQGYRDGWYVGYTGNFVTAVWFGNDNYKPSKRMTGGSLPAMTWKRFMQSAHRNVELRPIPYVGDWKPDPKEADEGDDKETVANRLERKLLSDESAAMLRSLEKKLRTAKPLQPPQKLAAQKASQQAGETIKQ